MQEFI